MAEWYEDIGGLLNTAGKWAGNNAGMLGSIGQVGASIYGYTQQADAQQQALRAQQAANAAGVTAQTAGTQQGIAAQQQSAAAQLAFQQQAYDQNRADLAPYRAAGTNALSQFEANAAVPFGQSPGYQFRMQEGLRGVQNSAAARGMTNSGRNLRGIMDYGQEAANGEYGNYMNRLQALSGIGQTANQQGVAANTGYANASGAAAGNLGNQTSTLYGNQANALTTLYGQQGQIGAAGAMQGATGFNTGMNNLLNYWQQR